MGGWGHELSNSPLNPAPDCMVFACDIILGLMNYCDKVSRVSLSRSYIWKIIAFCYSF